MQIKYNRNHGSHGYDTPTMNLYVVAVRDIGCS